MASENQGIIKRILSHPVWAGIAGIVAVIGLIIILLPLFRSSEYRLTATGEYFPFSIPNFLLEDMKKFKSSIDIGTLKKELIDKDNKGNSNTSTSKKSDSANEDKKTSDNSDMFWDFYKYIDERYPSNSIEEAQRFHSYWEFSIVNIGSKEITDLTLELPFDGYYALNRPGEPNSFSKFDKSIKLGSIRPTNNLKVTVWSSQPPLRYPTTERITYPNGAIDVEYPAKVTGFLGWLGSIWPIVTESFKILFILAIVNLPVQAVLYFLRKRSQNKKDKLREEISDGLEKVKEIITQAQQNTPIEEPQKKKAPRKELID